MARASLPSPAGAVRGLLASSAAPASHLSALTGRVLTPLRVAQARTAVGTGLLLRPALLTRSMGVPPEAAEQTGWAVQMLGAREVALGVGTLAALRTPDRRASRTWLAAGVLCDAVDAVAITGALLRGRVRKGTGAAVLAVALSAVALGSHALEEDEPDI